VKLLSEIFPSTPDAAAGQDYAEPPAPRSAGSYTREHAEIITPMSGLFEIVREISVAISHEVGAFG
jgi:phosphoenolpyruvate carboxylase